MLECPFRNKLLYGRKNVEKKELLFVLTPKKCGLMFRDKKLTVGKRGRKKTQLFSGHVLYQGGGVDLPLLKM